jgi:hypothetical protein
VKVRGVRYIYIYIYRERERKTDIEREHLRHEAAVFARPAVHHHVGVLPHVLDVLLLLMLLRLCLLPSAGGW